jgi:hypothetical protein
MNLLNFLKRFQNLFLLLCSIFLIQSCKNMITRPSSDAIPVVGLTDDGKVQELYLPRKIYRKQLSENLNSVIKEVPAALETIHHPERWKVYQVIVGLGIGIEVGIPKILSVGSDATVRLWFRDINSYN